ncbi:MAG: hypothetical protein INH41_31435 [Myxococcaceae bacterium]|nr:hypothetical protein [Myxococcaceae bacterium]
MLDTRRVLKIFHELSSAGVIGAIAANMVLLSVASLSNVGEYLVVRRSMDAIARLVLLPSIGVVLFTGVLAIAVHRPFHGAGWAWLKAIFGVSMLEGTLGAVNATAREGLQLAEQIAAGKAEPSAMNDVLRHEWAGMWVVLTLSIFNIVIGVWRPKLQRANRGAAASPTGPTA